MRDIGAALAPGTAPTRSSCATFTTGTPAVSCPENGSAPQREPAGTECCDNATVHQQVGAVDEAPPRARGGAGGGPRRAPRPPVVGRPVQGAAIPPRSISRAVPLMSRDSGRGRPLEVFSVLPGPESS